MATGPTGVNLMDSFRPAALYQATQAENTLHGVESNLRHLLPN